MHLFFLNCLFLALIYLYLHLISRFWCFLNLLSHSNFRFLILRLHICSVILKKISFLRFFIASFGVFHICFIHLGIRFKLLLINFLNFRSLFLILNYFIRFLDIFHLINLIESLFEINFIFFFIIVYICYVNSNFLWI
jgi:hypothetical protein